MSLYFYLFATCDVALGRSSNQPTHSTYSQKYYNIVHLKQHPVFFGTGKPCLPRYAHSSPSLLSSDVL